MPPLLLAFPDSAVLPLPLPALLALLLRPLIPLLLLLLLLPVLLLRSFEARPPARMGSG
jgi:uncharacterized RDD family membrane protein YckC